MKRSLLIVASAWLFWVSSLEGGEPKPEPVVRFSRKKVRSKDLVTVWYRFRPLSKGVPKTAWERDRPGRQMIFDHVHPVLARQGLALNKDYFLDRDDKHGILAITGKPEVADLVLRVIGFLDEDQPQIRISMRIVETLHSGDLQTGLDLTWDRKTSERTFFRGFEMDNRPQAYLDHLLSPSVPFQGTSTEFGTVDAQGNIINQEQYDRVGALYMSIRGVSEYQHSEIHAAPDIMVSNGVEAFVNTGSRYPYQKVTFSGTTATISTEWLSVDINMKVTPWIIGKDKIKMRVEAKVSNVIGFVEIAQGAKNPYTEIREIKDTVILSSGTTLAIGGLYLNENTLVEKGVPILMDIPILGFLFKSFRSLKTKKELRFYVRPKIVQPFDRFFVPSEE